MEPMRGYLDRPLTSEELLKIAKMLDGVAYRFQIGVPPNFSVIRFYDDENSKDWGAITVPLYFKKDLEAIARHYVRFLQTYAVEIYRTELYEKQRSLQKELDVVR